MLHEAFAGVNALGHSCSVPGSPVSRCCRRCRSRRAFLVGLPFRKGFTAALARNCAANAWRTDLLASSSTYSFAASAAGPRFSLSASTVTRCSKAPMRICSASPVLISFDGFGRSALSVILPPSTACAARLRVLKKRAAHSHLSMRTRSSLLVERHSVDVDRQRGIGVKFATGLHA